MKIVKVKLGEKNYPIMIGTGLVNKIGSLIKKSTNAKVAFVITNNKIKNLHGKRLAKSLNSSGITANFILVKDSEKSKSINTWVKVIQKITKQDKGEAIVIIAFGGGVIGDLAGFAASSYKRGVPLIHVPTTLLAQVDSAIGGKTAVDLSFGKNLIGAFYQPNMVISDIDLIKTLPPEELKNGMAEVIKYGIILDRNLFYFLEKNINKIKNKDKKVLLHIVGVCSRLKAGVVSMDEKETTGYRSILNFGHTIGHALEAASAYSENMVHGRAISIGMLCACDIARKINMLSIKDAIKIENLIKKAGLPTSEKNISPRKVLDAVSHDKKIKQAKLRFVLPVCIGHVTVCTNIDKKLIKNAILNRTIKQ